MNGLFLFEITFGPPAFYWQEAGNTPGRAQPRTMESDGLGSHTQEQNQGLAKEHPLVPRKGALLTCTQRDFYNGQGPVTAVCLHSSPFLAGMSPEDSLPLLHYGMLET